MKKVLIALGVIMILIVAVIVVLPKVYEKEIQNAVLSQMSSQINGELQLTDFDVTLIPNFPDLTVEISDLELFNDDSIDNTIVSINQFWFTVDLFQLMDEKLVIESIGADGVTANLIVDQNGSSNLSKLIKNDSKENNADPKPQNADSEPTNFSITISSYSFKNVNILYYDRQSDLKAEILNLNHSGEGRFNAVEFDLNSITEIGELNYQHEGITMLKKANFFNKMGLNINLDESKVSVIKSVTNINELNMNLAGWVSFPNDSLELDIKISSENNSFKELFSLVPDAYVANYDQVDVTGNMSVEMEAKGVFTDNNYPAFNMDVSVVNGKVRYPDLPASADNILVDLHVSHSQGGLHKLKSRLDTLNVEIGQNSFGANLFVDDPMRNPTVSGNVQCNFDLSSIPTFIPVEENQKFEGIIEANTQFVFDVAQIEGGHYSGVNAQGSLVMKNVDVHQGNLNTHINNARLNFSENEVSVPNCNVLIGASDFDLSGKVSNLIPYYLNDETLAGELTLKSNTINADELMALMTTDEEDSLDTTAYASNSVREGESTISLIPRNLELKLNTNVNKLVYDSVDYQSIDANCSITQGTFLIHSAGLDLFNGTVKLNGIIDAYNTAELFDFNLSASFNNWDISAMASDYNTVSSLAPIIRGANGILYGKVHVLGAVSNDYNPQYETLSFDGVLGSKNVSISTSTLEAINKRLNSEKFNPIEAKSVSVKFHCKNGVLETDPFHVYIAGRKATISGYTTLDQEINYVIKTKVKTSNLEEAGAEVANQLTRMFGSSDKSYKMPTYLPVSIQLTGSLTAPKISPKFEGNNVKQNAKEQIEEQVEQKIKEVKEDLKKDAKVEAAKIIEQAKVQQQQILNEAELQGEKLKEEADKVAIELVKEANLQAANLEKQATNPLTKIAAQKAGQEIIKEAKQQGENVKQEANEQAKKLMEMAKKRSDAVLKNAEERAQDIIDGV